MPLGATGVATTMNIGGIALLLPLLALGTGIGIIGLIVIVVIVILVLRIL
jgi:hypothetical protein